MKVYIYKADGNGKLHYVCKNKKDFIEFIIYHGYDVDQEVITSKTTIDDLLEIFSKGTNDFTATTRTPAKYKVVIFSNFSYGREYDSESRDALKCAYKYGRCEFGEKVYIKDIYGETISGAMWSVEDRKYVRILI